MMTDLVAIHDGRKSFYGKAKVGIMRASGGCGESLYLYSYNTMVARVRDPECNGRRVAEVYNLQSVTTLRHVKEFLIQQGFQATGKAQITRDYWAKK